MVTHLHSAAHAVAIAFLPSVTLASQPAKLIDFDVQSIVTEHKLLEQPIEGVTKRVGPAAEDDICGKAAPHLVVRTNDDARAGGRRP